MDATETDDLTIPDFLKASGPGTPCEFKQAAQEREVEWPYDVRPDNCTPADIAVMDELTSKQRRADALKQYEDEKRLAALEQWRYENPELAKMERQAKRDAARRIAKLGIKARPLPRRR
jgi:hypothetical protein